MKNILDNIAKFRKEQGLSYENMAHELDLSVGAYRKIELAQTHLTVERLYQISETLHTTVAKILGIEGDEYNQTNGEKATVYSQKIENFYQENKETHEKLFVSQQETIATLQTLVLSLQEQLRGGQFYAHVGHPQTIEGIGQLAHTQKTTWQLRCGGGGYVEV